MTNSWSLGEYPASGMVPGGKDARPKKPGGAVTGGREVEGVLLRAVEVPKESS